MSTHRFWKEFVKANTFRGGIDGLDPSDFVPEHATREVWTHYAELVAEAKKDFPDLDDTRKSQSARFTSRLT